jgi:hypothetical protein
MVGSAKNDRFYPDFAGVAKSYNFYPVPPQNATDGIVQVALGLGKTVVDGGNSVRFCPKFPDTFFSFSTKRPSGMRNYALDLDLVVEGKEYSILMNAFSSIPCHRTRSDSFTSVRPTRRRMTVTTVYPRRQTSRHVCSDSKHKIIPCRIFNSS